MTKPEPKCTEFVEYEGDGSDWCPCSCPVCGGFLKWQNIEDIPICNKCGTELLVIPEHDEETGEDLGCGKICPISLPKKKP